MSFTFSEKKNNFTVFFDPLHFEKLTLSIFKSEMSKDAGFVYESLRNESSNLEKKIFSKRIHETNLSKTNPRNESTIRILKVRSHESGFANPNLKDS